MAHFTGDARPDAVGTLPDGTPHYAPVGELVADGDLVRCHLCGCWRRSVTAHLRAHGWTKDTYCAAFGLERGQSLEGEATRKLRAASFSARLVFEAALRDGSARGRARARSGELARDAAAVARGRPMPEQRRRKARKVMAGRRHPASVRASQASAQHHLRQVAARAASELGEAQKQQADCRYHLAAWPHVEDAVLHGHQHRRLHRGCGQLTGLAVPGRRRGER